MIERENAPDWVIKDKIDPTIPRRKGNFKFFYDVARFKEKDINKQI